MHRSTCKSLRFLLISIPPFLDVRHCERNVVQSECQLDSFSRQRRRPRRRHPLACPDVFRPPAFVLLRRQSLQFRLATFKGLLINLLEKRNAPAATGAGAAAERKLAGNFRLFAPDEIDELAPRDVKAVAD